MRIIEVNAAGMYGIGAYSKILNGLPEKRNFDIKDIARRGGVNIPYDGNPDGKMKSRVRIIVRQEKILQWGLKLQATGHGLASAIVQSCLT